MFVSESENGRTAGQDRPKKIRRRRMKPIKWAFAKTDGAGRDASRGLEEIERRIAEAKESLNKIGEMLRENHHVVATCADLLNVSQPPAAGKIEVRWWQTANNRVSPTMVQWSEGGLPERIKPIGLGRKCNSRSDFQINHEETKRIAAILEDVLAARAHLLTKLSNLSLGKVHGESFHDSLQQLTEKKTFDEIFERIAENMRKAGKW